MKDTSYEDLSKKVKAMWIRLAADIVNNSATKDEAYDRLNKIAHEAEEALNGDQEG